MSAMIREATELDYAALLAGVAPDGLRLADSALAPPEVMAMLSGVADKVRATFAPTSWLIVAEGELVGLCSIVKAPKDGVVEIGYGVAPSRRQRGHATTAVADIVRWARSRSDIVAVAAETSVVNLASKSVLTCNGFVQVGERIDAEDGPLICWRCET